MRQISRSHGSKIVKFDPNWAFPDCNSSLNSPMAMKCCTKLETAKERCPIVFQGHPSNFKVTQYKTSPILTQIGRFRTIGRSQLSNPSDLPCYFIKSHFWTLFLALNIVLHNFSQFWTVFPSFGREKLGKTSILGRELGPSGVSPNQNSRWKLAFSPLKHV